MKICSVTFLLFITLLHFPSFAQHIDINGKLDKDGYEFMFYDLEHKNALSDSTELKPLVVFLHGASLCGNNIERVRRYGTIDAIERGIPVDAYVIAPQNRGGAWSPKKVWSIVEWVESSYPIDQNRIYVVGMSLGGFGTFSMASEYSDKIAAAMALCGGGVRLDYDSLNSLPLWILHGTADKAVPVGRSEEIVNGINKRGGERLIYTPLKGENHSNLARCFYLPAMYNWLFAHNLQDSARVVNSDYDITVADMKKAYNNSTGRKNMKIVDNRKKNSSKSKSKAKEAPKKVAEEIAVPPEFTAIEEDTTSAAMTVDETIDIDIPQFYTIKQGDSLYKIARKYNTTVAKLCEINRISTSTILKVGKELRVR